MGAAYTPICGTVLCGQTNAATWRTTWTATPTETLKARTFSISIVEGPLISLSVNRPVLTLLARPTIKQTTISKSLARPRLLLSGRAFVIPPVLRVELNSPRLYLYGRAVLLALSSTLSFGRPQLLLNAGELSRVGRAGLVPTIPRAGTLTPSPVQSGTLVPSTPEQATLLASATGTRALLPTDVVEGDLLVPSETSIR